MCLNTVSEDDQQECGKTLAKTCADFDPLL
jgi:hypothetical protein